MNHKFLNINWDLFDKESAKDKEMLRLNTQNNIVTYNKPLTYFVPPPMINSSFYYQDINTDANLRDNVTNFFLKKTIKWINKYDEFKNNKNLLPKLKTDIGYDLIYNILRQFVKKNNCNWYDLRSNYILVKDFIRYRLNK